VILGQAAEAASNFHAGKADSCLAKDFESFLGRIGVGSTNSESLGESTVLELCWNEVCKDSIDTGFLKSILLTTSSFSLLFV